MTPRREVSSATRCRSLSRPGQDVSRRRARAGPVGRGARAGAPALSHGARARRRFVLARAGRAGRLHRAERRRASRTTVKILAGHPRARRRPRARSLGRVPWRERIAHVAQIGVVFGQRTQLWWDLPVIESFDLLRDIYRVPRDRLRARARRADRAARPRAAARRAGAPAHLGQRMRCDLAASLLHAPSILFLDEPTIGLDAVSKLAVRDFVKRLNRERGVTVILTTHDMDDIEALCTRVIVIGDGQDPLRRHARRPARARDARALADGRPGRRRRESIDDPDATVIRRDGDRVCLRVRSAGRLAGRADPARDEPRTRSATCSSRTRRSRTIIARLYGEAAIVTRLPRDLLSARFRDAAAVPRRRARGLLTQLFFGLVRDHDPRRVLRGVDGGARR